MDASITVTTAVRPGAIAVLQLVGADVPNALASVLERAVTLGVGRVSLVKVPGIDDAVLARVTATTWQLMPHGGPRVVQRIVEACASAGMTVQHEPAALQLYPEARSEIEADMLSAIARAASPAAIDRLLAQPARWRAAWEASGRRALETSNEAHPWDRLLTPATVVVVGRPNVGKSTLLNAVSGRSVALVADLPGTTRDWVGGFVELPWRGSFVAVRWLDTPGLRTTDDPAERAAITAARTVMRSADVLVAMRDFEHDWLGGEDLPRSPDVHVVNKCDTPQRMRDAATLAIGPHPVVPISADSGAGLPALVDAVTDALGIATADDASLWPFSQTLAQGGDLSGYLGASRGCDTLMR